jgi:hypothetical protein
MTPILLGPIFGQVWKPKAFDMDKAEAAILQLPPVHCPVENFFVGGFYIRQIFMPAGSIVASFIHNTRHSYSVTKGRVRVVNDLDGSFVEIVAPFVGITEPGTRRLLHILEDCVWTTFHAFDSEERNPDTVVSMLTQHHVNSELGIAQAEIQNLHLSLHSENPPLPMNTPKLAEQSKGGSEQ